MEKNARLRLLYVMEMLLEETDKEHGLAMKEIIRRLAEKGISSERKSVYEDIHALQDYGLCIEYQAGDKTYHFVNE